MYSNCGAAIWKIVYKTILSNNDVCQSSLVQFWIGSCYVKWTRFLGHTHYRIRGTGFRFFENINCYPSFSNWKYPLILSQPLFARLDRALREIKDKYAYLINLFFSLLQDVILLRIIIVVYFSRHWILSIRLKKFLKL